METYQLFKLVSFVAEVVSVAECGLQEQLIVEGGRIQIGSIAYKVAFSVPCFTSQGGEGGS